ncbi:MAG: class I SAM-dependent methyltransferase, partial [Eubacteriales bacterium]
MGNGLEKPEYGNWVSKRLIIRMLIYMIVFAALAFAGFWIPGFSGLGVVFVILAVFFLIMYLYFLAARYVLSWEGGGVQPKIIDLLLSHISGEYASILDIGCGSGALSVKLAKRFPSAVVTGIDFWQGKWGYSAEQCKNNALLEGVAERTVFLRATASRLPFEDSAFELVVSNFAFHEVQDTKD